MKNENNKQELTLVPLTLDAIRSGDDRSKDFISLEKLQQMSGITCDEIIKFAVVQMLENALDKDSNIINITLTSEDDFYTLSVSDNGSKTLSLNEIKKILNFNINGSSKRGLKIVSRGSMGNALKLIVGFSYALAKERNLPIKPIIIESGTFKYTVRVKPNAIVEIIPINRKDDNLTTFTIKFPLQEDLDVSTIKDMLEGNSLINSTWLINTNILGEIRSYGSVGINEKTKVETSVLWYKESEFITLFNEYAKDFPNAPLKDFITLFRGFGDNSSDTLLFLQKINIERSRLFTTRTCKRSAPLSDVTMESEIKAIYAGMIAESKPIKDKRTLRDAILRPVGEEVFKKLCEKNDWQLTYKTILDINPKCPYLFEIAFIIRQEDHQGRKLYYCINHMVSTKTLFSNLAPIEERLGDVNLEESFPLTLIIHLITPCFQYLNQAKTILADSEE